MKNQLEDQKKDTEARRRWLVVRHRQRPRRRLRIVAPRVASSSPAGCVTASARASPSELVVVFDDDEERPVPIHLGSEPAHESACQRIVSAPPTSYN